MERSEQRVHGMVRVNGKEGKRWELRRTKSLRHWQVSARHRTYLSRTPSKACWLNIYYVRILLQFTTCNNALYAMERSLQAFKQPNSKIVILEVLHESS